MSLAEIVIINNGNGAARLVRTIFQHVDGRGDPVKAQAIIDKINTPAMVSDGISSLGPRR